jgi:O-antigen ligase
VNIQVLPARLIDPDSRPSGVLLVVTILMVLAAAILGAWLAISVFLVAIVLLLALLAYAASRWPRATFVAAVLATLGDPTVIRGVLPADVHFLVTAFSEVLVGMTGLIVLVHGIRARRLVSALRDPVTVLGAAFALVAIVSAFVNGVSPLIALLGIIATLDALAVYYMARMLPFERRSISLAIAALVGVATLASVLGIMQALLTPQILWFQAFAGRFGEGGRVTGFMGNPNMLAALIGFTIPFPLFATRELHGRARWIAIAALFVLALGLMLTFSRGAWVAVLVGIVVGAVLIDWRVLRIMAAAVVVAYLVAAFMPRNILVQPDQLPPYAQGTAEEPPDIFDSIGNRFDAVTSNKDLRVRFVVEGLPILLDHPWLGVGPGQYGGAIAKVFDSPVYEEYGTSLYGFRTVHNFWLHTLGEVGILGTALFLTLVVGLVIRLVHHARAATGIDRLVLGGAATAAIVVILHDLTEMLFEGNSPAFAIWLVLGLASLLAPAAGLRPSSVSEPTTMADGPTATAGPPSG